MPSFFRARVFLLVPAAIAIRIRILKSVAVGLDSKCFRIRHVDCHSYSWIVNCICQERRARVARLSVRDNGVKRYIMGAKLGSTSLTLECLMTSYDFDVTLRVTRTACLTWRLRDPNREFCIRYEYHAEYNSNFMLTRFE